ncbi:competence protein CoiA family protein [Streptodolium elevatio]|uniref:Competence protein CoiA family protein n=1 Tax=Streptodolium elevatio TaxID=3157996 RepID=A0ABV3DU17_9ACTN
MVFVGMHGQWGRIDTTQPDLGCGQDRESIYKPKSPVPLTCYDCGWRLHLVHRTHGRYDLWFLRHAPHAPDCAAKAAGEGLQHHLLKLDLAHHARAAGWTAEFEVAAPDGSWRADVLATSPDGERRVALEAQMSAITVTDIEARTGRYRAAGIEVCWFTDRKTVPWLDYVPSVQIARVDDGPVQVTAGPARFVPEWCEDREDCGLCACAGCGPGVDGPLPCGGHGTWAMAGPLPLERFVAAICADTTRPYRLRTQGWDEHGRWRWITRAYFALEDEQVRAESRRQEVITRRLEPERRQEAQHAAGEDNDTAAQAHHAAILALLQRQRALMKPVFEFVRHETGALPKVADEGSPDFAMGVPVYVRGAPYAVICPVAGRVTRLREQLAKVVFFAATDRERWRIAAQAVPGQRIEVIQVDHAPSAPETPQRRGDSEFTVKQAVNRMLGLDRM